MQVQFNPGDKVRRITDSFDEVERGGVYTVRRQDGTGLYLAETALVYNATYFELVAPVQSLEEQIKVVEEMLSALKKQKEELEKATTYSIGQRFESGGKEYLLAQVDFKAVCLIDLEEGNRHNDPIQVANPGKITQEELDCAQAGYKFALTK